MKLLPISVVIPAHNAEPFIEAALKSVRSQTAKPAEIIVVDDGSIDKTAEIAFSFGVTVLRQRKQGPSAARNSGVIAATQPWIAFLDADDLWEPDKLRDQWTAVGVNTDIGVVFTDFTEFDEKGLRPNTFLSQLRHYQQVRRSEIVPGIYLLDEISLQVQFSQGNFIRTSTLMIRRDLLLQVGLFDNSITHCEDRELCLRLQSVTKTAVVERPLVRYRLTDGSLSSDDYKMWIGRVMVADKVLANPKAYSSPTVDYYRRQQSLYCLNAGRYAEECGEIRTAFKYYLRSWHLGGGIKPLMLAILTQCPFFIRTLVRTSLGSMAKERNNVSRCL